MHPWARRLFLIAAPLLLAGCLWGPGKFTSDLTLRKDGSFTLDYRGEIVLELPPDDASQFAPEPWNPQTMARCHRSGRTDVVPSSSVEPAGDKDPLRPCTAAELARLKAQHDRDAAANAAEKRKDADRAASFFGLAGLDDESARAFAAKLKKYAGWRSVAYRGHGTFDVDYHFEGRATQDFLFPLLPDNNLIVPFIALRRRADGAVLVTAPALAGLSALGPAANRVNGDEPTPPSRGQGRFTVHTDGQILTNNSEDGAASDPVGRQVHWDIAPGTSKVPETLIGLQ